MNCTPRNKKALLYLTEKLMNEAGIEIRDTWKGYQNEDITIQSAPDNGACLFEKEREVLDGFKSLSYKNPTITISDQQAKNLNPLIHETVHFLQYNTVAKDDAYFTVESYTLPHFKKFLTQKEETEAHFIQMLFISRYELHIVKPREQQQFKKRMLKALYHPDMRIDMIFWAVKNGVFV
jgi:hypothetical protein